MKAAVYDNPGVPAVLEYVDMPDPVCGPSDVLIAVEAISIEGGDLINRRTTKQESRWIVGYAAAGTIVAVGENVKYRTVGQKVVAFDMQGSHAELWAVQETRTWLVPDGLRMADAAVMPISFGTAYHCVSTKGQLHAEETVLIHGAAGGVGIAAVQLARQAGAQVIAVASGNERQARLRALGATHLIDRHNQDVVEEVRRLTGGKGADLVIDPVGSTVQSSLLALAPEGRLVFVGNAGGGGLAVELWQPMQNNQTLHGVFMGALFERPAVHETVDALLKAATDRRLEVVIDRTFSLKDAASAHEHAETAKPLGRVVMKV
ncbi:zinc-binding alcohol dehydrogenase family protein [Agrobacterium radiobacter]|uniref:quinone oxidoreductase family protein n=1 Tax=Agrobacterium radiobacter TaxID=362 RepID=UPI00035DF39A|nr:MULTISPECIES: zinc-binding alcohol dehydrogenase family protein [Agrobacterium tumefaciens complex]EPR23325.1 NADP-dependent oxidoreductase [Agrobacterium radiobacter DSM 30147]KAB0459268.1 zinc-binding alcohol dehydrogenase family protein [Agrobacterium tumefaciens]KWT75467.1 NADP-dependent oxidoreductase [Agrobacterium radiobacter]NIB11686.1 zinc-binding alcohol dehydrogenase family protein [Agrobacterium radiobacter]OOO33187.1 NADP-dependent oxidoreductase [Agrobacterium radiobacter]